MMRIFVHGQNQSQEQTSLIRVRSAKPAVGLAPSPSSVMYLQRTLGNQGMRQLLQARSEQPDAAPVTNVGPSRLLRIPELLASSFQQLADGKPNKTGEKKSEPGKPPTRDACDRKCGTSGGPYGNTECELDLRPGGVLTGKVTKEIFDTDPCTRPCVEVHEEVHAKKIAPICGAAKKCLDAAAGDLDKQDKCLDKFQADMDALVFSTECAAYAAEEKCLRERAKKPECTGKNGKKRWNEQVSMVKCYKDCFCKS